jgi:hypothetical protein
MPDMTAQPNITTDNDLDAEGWIALEVRWGAWTYDHPSYGLTRWFDVIGDVPTGQGLYIFTLGHGPVDIRYAGKSSYLLMVTRGVGPGHAPRRGNCYGRPRWAGGNRQRSNALLTQNCDLAPRMWNRALRGVGETALGAAEQAAIGQWELRRYGWNRA